MQGKLITLKAKFLFGLTILVAGLSLFLAACGDSAATATPAASVQPPAPTQAATATPTTVPAVVSATVAGGNLTTAATATTAASPTPVPATPTTNPSGFAPYTFQHVFIIVLENANYDRALRQPYLGQIAKNGTLFTNFHAVAHPSYPNYLAMVAGSTFGITDDSQRDLDQTNLVDLMETAGISWKTYAEQYPSRSCFTGVLSGGYVRKHVPFLSFVNVQKNPARCSKIVEAGQLKNDVAAGQLPQYSLYIPDLNNDGHDTGSTYASKWLEGFLSPLLQNPNFKKDTLVVVIYDEDDDSSPTNQVYTVFLGEPVISGQTNDTYYTHYNLLRTIEDNFKLGNLGREDAKAKPITNIWQKGA